MRSNLTTYAFLFKQWDQGDAQASSRAAAQLSFPSDPSDVATADNPLPLQQNDSCSDSCSDVSTANSAAN